MIFFLSLPADKPKVISKVKSAVTARRIMLCITVGMLLRPCNASGMASPPGVVRYRRKSKAKSRSFIQKLIVRLLVVTHLIAPVDSKPSPYEIHWHKYQLDEFGEIVLPFAEFEHEWTDEEWNAWSIEHGYKKDWSNYEASASERAAMKASCSFPPREWGKILLENPKIQGDDCTKLTPEEHELTQLMEDELWKHALGVNWDYAVKERWIMSELDKFTSLYKGCYETALDWESTLPKGERAWMIKQASYMAEKAAVAVYLRYENRGTETETQNRAAADKVSERIKQWFFEKQWPHPGTRRQQKDQDEEYKAQGIWRRRR